jgi:PleD family two-component response regulator
MHESRGLHNTATRLYNEQAFQWLLLSEPKRSERSGCSFCILLIYSTDKQGLTVQMDRDMVDTVVKALLRTLRETDYIGWHIEGRIVGGVLTALEHDSAVDVSGRIQQRVIDKLRVKLSVEENSRLQIRVCQYHEMEGIES